MNVEQHEVGRTYFPVTKGGIFDCKCELTVTYYPIQQQGGYKCVGANAQFHYPAVFGDNSDASLSIISSYQMAVDAGAIDGKKKIFLNIAPCSLTSIGGASEGAATVLAFLGCKMPENSMITGFVDSFGLTKISHSELMNEPIHKIDCLKSKALGAGKCRLTLLFPEENAHEFGKDIPKNAIPVATIGKALSQIKKMQTQ